MMIAEDIKIECEENGFHLFVDGETWLIANPEQLYDRVKAAIGPWLKERDDAFSEFRAQVHRGAFVCHTSDVDESGGLDEHWHSIHADIWDNRDGK